MLSCRLQIDSSHARRASLATAFYGYICRGRSFPLVAGFRKHFHMMLQPLRRLIDVKLIARHSDDCAAAKSVVAGTLNSQPYPNQPFRAAVQCLSLR